MPFRNIIVVGASAGGFEALQQLVGGLPPNFAASLFIVWHMAPDLRGILPKVLQHHTALPVSQARDGAAIAPGQIIVAAPDHHLILEHGRMRVTHGPKEHRFRPAVDPLFRSAAYVYGQQVVGIVLSGALDDGTAGLWTIKQHGGVAIAQDPQDALFPSMPSNAIHEVAIDYVVPVAAMAELLVRLCQEPLAAAPPVPPAQDEQTALEVRIATQANALEAGIMRFGELTPYTCPECHGVLSAMKEGPLLRFRCHTGHAFSPDSLLNAVTEQIEDRMWSAIRGIEESALLLNHMGDHFAEANQPKLAARYFQKAQEALARTRGMREIVLTHEHLSTDSLLQDVA